jgi:hypothetical protein
MYSARRPLVILAFALAAAACGPTTGTATPSQPTTSAAQTPLISVAPVEPGTSDAPAAGQTDTEWGRIWDALPAGFPTYPGSTIADDASADPVSARYAIIGGDPAEIASWLQTALETATYSTEGLSGPFEDGSFVLDSVGEAGCRIETTIAPLGRLTFVSINYGAVCPPA